VFSRFFIDRPIFATVLSIAITLAGFISLGALPIAMYPQIAPPTVMVTCQYPGASAQVVAETVAAPIEQQVNGVENMMYMSSQCTNDGNYSLTVTFKHGVDMNLAQVLVQNRVSLATPLLPDVIKATGVLTKKRSPDILLAIGICSSPHHSLEQLYLSNYAFMHIKDEIARIEGVSDVNMFGQRDYSMRIWIDPDKLAVRNMTAGDVVRALREQNLQVASGQVGQSPTVPGQETQITLSTLGRLLEPEQFGKVIVKTTPDGRVVRIRDIGRVELGAKNQDISSKVDGVPVANLAVFQLPDANALATADRVKAKIAELKKEFPPGVDYMIRYDTTPFIRESIMEVFWTLIDSVILVALVVLLFLQNWRSALIPLVAVPVGIVGTFAVMLALGFSLNNLTLFGLVLSIGIVVDDAIVVVECVEHHIERGLAPRAATIKAMSEVSAPVIAVGLVLSAVFIPAAFITGITGQFFRQFALTIASSTLLSTINSLTLSPALAAMLLRPRRKGVDQVLPWPVYLILGGWAGYEWLGPYLLESGSTTAHLAAVAPVSYFVNLAKSVGLQPEQAAGMAGAVIGALAVWAARGPLNRILGFGFDLFNRGFRATAGGYARMVGGMLRVSLLVLFLYGGLLAITYWGFQRTPRGFIPSQDMGYLLANIQLPDSASIERTEAVLDRMAKIAHEIPGVAATVGMSGQSLLLNAYGSNFGTMFITLDGFKERRSPALRSKAMQYGMPDLYYETVMNKLRLRLPDEITDADISLFGPPPVRGVGRAGGFMIMIEDRGDLGPKMLQEQVENLVLKGNNINILGNQIEVKPLARDNPAVKSAPAGPARKAEPPGLADLLVRWYHDVVDQLRRSYHEVADTGGAGAKERNALVGLTAVFRANVPQVYVDVDRPACMLKGVQLQDVFDTLQIYLGSLYVNDFNLFGRTWQVIAQAEARYRDQEDDIRKLRVRNATGTMVPLGAVAKARLIEGPLVLSRYNMYPAASINGNAARGVSTGTAIDVMGDLAFDELPKAMSYEWTELAYLELQAGSTAMLTFGFSIVMVFLVLAAQFESWSMPLAVILSVPLCVLSALVGVNASKLDINIFTQIGLVVLVGLASKNAILIVEFAKVIHRTGKPIREATLESCRLRLRPIIMTSMAFILGVIPLLLSVGAGAEMRQSLGMAVFSGMIGVTLFGVLLTPVFFFVIDTLSESNLFASGPLRRFGDIVIGILSLRFVRNLAAGRLNRSDRGPAQSPGAEPADWPEEK
jgi:multidrug efflux pump